MKSMKRTNAVYVTAMPWWKHGRSGQNGGTVITVGTTDWSFGLGTDRAVEQVTHNALRASERR